MKIVISILPLFLLGVMSCHQDGSPKNTKQYSSLSSFCDSTQNNDFQWSFESKVEKVKVVWYSDSQGGFGSVITKDDLHKELNVNLCKSIVELNNDQIEKLNSVLKFSRSGLHDMASCYHPRHCIIYENKKGDIIEFLEICFECKRSRGSSDELILYCNIQLERLEQLFESYSN